MKFMVQVRANADSEAGYFPPNASEMFEAMDRFNQGLVRDGMLLSADGLQPSSKGARIVWQDGKARVIDGPFAEAKELIAGYWVIEAASKDAVVQRFLQCPPPADGKSGEIEIRPVYGPDDFPEGVLPDEVRAHEEQWPGNKPKAAPRT